MAFDGRIALSESSACAISCAAGADLHAGAILYPPAPMKNAEPAVQHAHVARPRLPLLASLAPVPRRAPTVAGRASRGFVSFAWSCGLATLFAIGCGGGGKVTPSDGGALGDGGAPADGGARTDGGAGRDGGAVADGGAPPMLRCKTSGLPSAPRFRDATSAYALADVRGGRVSVGDLDGDGYPDLLVHTVGTHNRADFTKPPAQWPYRVLMNRPREGGGRTFVDQTRESGYATPRENGGDNLGRAAQFAIFADLNDDGHLDIYSGAYTDVDRADTDPGDRSEILLNDGAGRLRLANFSAAVAESEDGSRQTPTTSATFLDFDKDGHLDVFVGHFYGRGLAGVQNRLLHNAGDGSFDDVTDERGFTMPGRLSDRSDLGRPTYGVTACDVSGDGNPDVLVSAYGRAWNQLYLRDGDVFRDVGRASGFAGDSNLDYSDNEFYRCECQRLGTCNPNPGPARISCDADYWSAGVDDRPFRLNGNTFTTACGDLDNDGRMDLFSAEIVHWHIGKSSDVSEVLHNDGLTDGEPRFSRPGRMATGVNVPRVGTSWNEGGIGAAIADLDNDGRADILLATSDYPDQYLWLFRQKADGTFQEVSQASGVRHACAPAVALADLDRDGDLDLIVASSTARDCRARYPDGPLVKVYENIVGQDANWLQLQLEGKGAGEGGANRSAIGAIVKVTAGGVTQTREVQGGHGHFGIQHDLHVTVGLGATCNIDEVEVRWPDGAGTVQRFANVRANYRVHLKQGEAPRYVP